MGTISVRAFAMLAIEPTEKVRVYNNDTGEDVYEGTYRELSHSNRYYATADVESFGYEGDCICINISFEG